MVLTRLRTTYLLLAVGQLMAGQPIGYVQQGVKLVGTPGVGQQDLSVALSADGNTALIGGVPSGQPTWPVWLYLRTGGSWTQAGQLTGTGAVAGSGAPPFAVALSGDGHTALIGLASDN